MVTVLDPNLRVMWDDPVIVDASSAEVWPKEMCAPLRFLVWTQANSVSDQARTYAQVIGKRLKANVDRLHTPIGTGAALDALIEKVGRAAYDLVILEEPKQSLIKRLLLGAMDYRAVEQIIASLLVVRRPRWPLDRILLIVQGHEGDDAAVDWVVRLSSGSNVAVTVLVMVPPVPAMYYGMPRMQQGVTLLLDGDDALGRQTRRATQQLADQKIENAVRLCQGSPDLLIRREMLEGNYDLVVVAAERQHRWVRFLLGDLVVPILRWADQPVLVARP